LKAEEDTDMGSSRDSPADDAEPVVESGNPMSVLHSNADGAEAETVE